MRLYDISHPIHSGMPVFPGDPEVRLAPVETLPPWRVTRVALGSHSGTHVDAPSHFSADGRSITDYPVERFVLPAVIVPLPDLEDDEAISRPLLSAHLVTLPVGGAVLVATGWDRFWGSERYLRHPYLAEEAAAWLAASGIRLVGVDALNVDSTVSGTAHAHAVLLGNDVLIMENLRNLRSVPQDREYLLVCLPLPLLGADGAPARAVLMER